MTTTIPNLTSVEQAIVEVLAAFSESAPLTTIARALAKLGHRFGGRSPTNDAIRPLIDGLVHRGLVEGPDRYTLKVGLRHRAMLGAAREHRLESLAAAVRELRPRSHPDQPWYDWEQGLRDLRLELYSGHWEEARQLMGEAPATAVSEVCQPFDPAWVKGLPADLRSCVLTGIVSVATTELVATEPALSMLVAEPSLTDAQNLVAIEALALRGKLAEVELRLAGRQGLEAQVGRGLLALFRGQLREAVASYEAALHLTPKGRGSGARLLPGSAGLFSVLALAAEGSPASLTRAGVLAAAGSKRDGHQSGFSFLSDALEWQSGKKDPDELYGITSGARITERDALALLIQAAAVRWMGLSIPREVRSELEARVARARAAGLTWYATQAADLLAGSRTATNGIEGLRLATLLSRKERWAEKLTALLEVAAPKKAPATSGPSRAEGDHRLVWVVEKTSWGVDLSPRDQGLSKGVWSKGKPVALRRLYEEAKSLDFLTPADRKVCGAIETETTYEYYGRYPRVSYHLDSARALLALAGQDNVLIRSSGDRFDPCEIRRANPRLQVERKGKGLALSLVPRPAEGETVTVQVSGPRSVDLVEFTALHQRIAEVLGRKPLVVPGQGEQQVRAVLSALSGHVQVEADLPASEDGQAATAGDTRPQFLLRSLGHGLTVGAHVRPLGPEGPLVRAGEGGAALMAQVEGRPAHAARNLAEEARRLEQALAACPVLSAHRSSGADFVLSERDPALDAVLELRALGDAVTVEWPDGEAMRVSDPVDVDQLQLAIHADAGSFLADGALAIPGRPDLELVQLLGYLAASPGRFLILSGDERYLTLTAELRQRLDELLALSQAARTGRRIHPLLAPQVSDLLTGCQIKGDAAWKKQVTALRAQGDDPAVPSTLSGELRPYQVEGFHWLVRLSRWGAGACLADDMGLGKTLQSLAMLVQRAPVGPALVIAPKSVVPMWCDEAQRFAPTLRLRSFEGAERGQTLADLGPFDVLVTSYGILPLDIEALAEVEFATAILDEAQVIKNAGTQRAQAARQLRARFRVATTGTPVENRLEDLHSIFAFLNPGLLGSASEFQERFARPVERAGDAVARDRLRRLVAPFVLRRTKSEVLPELPARIETTLRVPLEREELSLYEAIRTKAIADLADGGGKVAGRMQILAAIMRLRRAASNARLVLPKSKAPSAKLAALEDLLDDLLPTGHKVLVFSQFVDHLTLIREHLDERGVSYQYLDGQTTQGSRKAAVDAFQAGQGDVFLISLKAGGVGLNLTAADYVVHMDPWWNPAVEDQASDRAHRIGQVRPVTIYRLVAQDTIEDVILGLHHRKRELAAGILDGADLAGRMSEEDLLDLIRQGPTLSTQ